LNSIHTKGKPCRIKYGMRNPRLPQPKEITNQIHQLIDINSLQMQPPHSLIEAQNPNRDESVEAKWEQIQYFEAKENPSLNSLASSTTNSTSSTSSTSSTTSSSANEKLKSRLTKLKQNGLKKLANFKLWSRQGKDQNQESKSSQQRSSQHSDPPEPPTNQEVSHAPNGLTKISKLRASKSMQNLEQITRDSLYNLKDISSNLKQKYNSRMELRQQSQMYNELWDDDADDVDEVDFYHRSYDY